jgi:hypothetical protein
MDDTYVLFKLCPHIFSSNAEFIYLDLDSKTSRSLLITRTPSSVSAFRRRLYILGDVGLIVMSKFQVFVVDWKTQSYLILEHQPVRAMSSQYKQY